MLIKQYCQLRKKTTLQDVRFAVTKANTLKRAADEKQELLDNALGRKKALMEKKQAL